MSSKPPSSLDYEAFLHELALRNWRRALLDGDTERAGANAARLALSHDRLWRFIGFLQLARARMCGGLPSEALDALARARRSYPDAQELDSLARTLAAHIHLETHSPRLALEVLAPVGLGDGRRDAIEVRYWRALAHARLGQRDEAVALVETCGSTRTEHVMGELDPRSRIERFERASHGFGLDRLASPEPATPIRFDLAMALLDAGEIPRASAAFGEITASRETLLHWPIPYVRSLFHVGGLAAKAGREESARLAFSEFLLWWKNGELDRAAVAEAAQFVKA